MLTSTNLPDVHRPNDSLLANALESAANAIFITDATGHILWANRAFSVLSGYSLDEVLGHTPALMKSGAQRTAFYAKLWRTILQGKVWRGVLTERRKDGYLYTVEQTITPLLDDKGAITHFISIQQDAGQRRSTGAQEHYLAYHDALTGLPNRSFLLETLRQEISFARRSPHQCALLFLDLDKFKPVNDTYGHSVGDELLLAIADRVSRAVRKSDTVARFGGDEFVILLPDLPNASVAATLAGKLNNALSMPFYIAGNALSISASIGISLYPRDSEDIEDLIRKADEAMYAVKKLGGNGFRFYGTAPL